MTNQKKFNWTALLLCFIFLLFLACQKMEKQFPTAIDDASKSRTKTIASQSLLLSATPDIIVNSTLDGADFPGPMQIDELPGPDGLVTLKEAIIAANNTSGPQIIGFNIPTDDPGFTGTVFVIQPRQGFPLQDCGTSVNGATQAEFSGDTNPEGPEIVLDGSSMEQPDFPAFTIQSNGNVIHQFVINNFSNAIGIPPNAANNVITGCYIGIDPTGQHKVGNRWDGIWLFGDNNQIGGYSTEERNVISGNEVGGIQMGGNSNLIVGNFIGTDVTGTKSVGNIASGIACGGDNNRFVENLISGNEWDGVQLGAAHNNELQGNLIGADVNGKSTLGNAEYGVRLTPGDENSSGNHIGGKSINEGNTIAGNGRGGILVGDAFINADNNIIEGNTIFNNNNGGVIVLFQSKEITISQNSIYSNEGLGIDLDGNGVTENDPGDEDSGTNNLMNFPVLTWAHAAPGQLVVKGEIDTPDPKNVIIEFFANPVPAPSGDPSGNGEGAIFLGLKKPNPQGKFTATLSPVAVGTLITATATDANGNTSEFSAIIEAVFP